MGLHNSITKGYICKNMTRGMYFSFIGLMISITKGYICKSMVRSMCFSYILLRDCIKLFYGRKCNLQTQVKITIISPGYCSNSQKKIFFSSFFSSKYFKILLNEVHSFRYSAINNFC